MEDIDVELSQLADLAYIEIGRREKRPLCNHCRRPVGVCWCGGVGGCRVETGCRVVVLQHPHEEKRCLRTAPILQAALPPSAYLEVKAKRFPFSRFPQLEEIMTSPQSVLMYPGERAASLDTLPPVGPRQPPYNIIIIDGTWQQAKSMYHNCRHLHALPQVCLAGRYVSKYVIRTQPTEDALSTVETAAIALATLEQDWSIYTTLLHPLQLLCHYQIKHGAVPHQSKEQMIASGRCRKPMGKRTYKKLRKCGARQAEGMSLSTLITSLHLRGDGEEDCAVGVCTDEREEGARVEENKADPVIRQCGEERSVVDRDDEDGGSRGDGEQSGKDSSSEDVDSVLEGYDGETTEGGVGRGITGTGGTCDGEGREDTVAERCHVAGYGRLGEKAEEEEEEGRSGCMEKGDMEGCSGSQDSIASKICTAEKSLIMREVNTDLKSDLR